eukprot:symbB.v1.2.039361.t1/scaffold6513.1/size17478/1
MCRSLLVAKLPVDDVDFLVATVHLESDSSELRREQLRQILQNLESNSASHVILAGDMNFGDFAVEEVELRQAEYHDCTSTSGHTMPRNDVDGKASRLDRIYTRESPSVSWRLVPSAPRLLGTEPLETPNLTEGNLEIDASDGDVTDPEMPPLIPVAFGDDHYGVSCTFELVRRKVMQRGLQPLAKKTPSNWEEPG